MGIVDFAVSVRCFRWIAKRAVRLVIGRDCVGVWIRGLGLKVGKARTTRTGAFSGAAVLLSVLLASCTSTSEPFGDFATDLLSEVAGTAEAEDKSANAPDDADGDDQQSVAVPTERPKADNKPLAIASTRQQGENAVAAISAADLSSRSAAATVTNSGDRGSAGSVVTNTVPSSAADKPSPKTKSSSGGFLASLFSSSPKSGPLAKNPKKPRPLVDLSDREENRKRPSFIRATIKGDSLPGVREKSSLFEIIRKSGLDDDSDIDINETSRTIHLASAAGLARLAPNGLIRQHKDVDVKCLKPTLVRFLKRIEYHYGRKVIVTSGYRSPARNRRARGARNSFHMYCAAVDIQVTGISKWQLANYVRSLPGRGGVGTYCHTKSVHVDIGPERDWNWRCRRRKK